MLRKIFIILIFYILSISFSFSMVPAGEGEIEYDKMIREANQSKKYTPSEIKAMQEARREAKNERIRQEMRSFAKSNIGLRDAESSKKSAKLYGTGDGVNKVNIILAIIVLIVGVFMLLYSYLSISHKKKR